MVVKLHLYKWVDMRDEPVFLSYCCGSAIVLLLLPAVVRSAMVTVAWGDIFHIFIFFEILVYLSSLAVVSPGMQCNGVCSHTLHLLSLTVSILLVVMMHHPNQHVMRTPIRYKRYCEISRIMLGIREYIASQYKANTKQILNVVIYFQCRRHRSTSGFASAIMIYNVVLS